MTPANKLPSPLKAAIAEVFESLYTHTDIDSRFFTASFPGDPPAGNKRTKCHEWLTRAEKRSPDPLRMVGALIEEIMERAERGADSDDHWKKQRSILQAQLSKLGYGYHVGGHIVPLSTKATAKILTQMIHEQGLRGVEEELDRISKNLEADPAAAVTASCALLEALFQSYIVDQALEMPSDKSILPLWKVVRDHLKLNPAVMPNESLRKVVSGLASIVDGIASLRTNHGSAHGRDSRNGYRMEPRHARLVANSASTLATFVLEVAHAKAERT